MIERDWKADSTQEQRNTLNAACGDLAKQIEWHGFRLSKDDFRHLLSGTVLGWRMYPGVDMGVGPPGFIMLGGSSLDLSRERCTDALTLAFSIGDDPSSQGLKSPPVRWCKSVIGARYIVEYENT